MLSIYYYIQAKRRHEHLKDWVEEMGGEGERSNAMLAAERDMAGLEMVYYRDRAIIAGYVAFTCVAISVMIAITYFFG